MPPIKDATKRPANLGELIPPATPTAQQVPPVPVNPAGDPGLASGSLGPAPAIWTDPYSSMRQWKRNNVSQGRFPSLPPKVNPQTNAASSSVAAKKVRPTQDLAQSTANQVQQNTAPPQNVTGLSISKEVGKTLDGTLMQVVVLSFVPPAPVSSFAVGTWNGVQVWQTGLTAGAEPVGVAGGTKSPLFINFPITGETITLYVESISATGIPSDAANVTNNPSITVTLDGATNAPPAPVIASSAAATNAGIFFSWNIVADPAANFVSEYKIYKGATSVFSAATCVDTVPQPANTTATTLTFNDVLAPGVEKFYWVSDVDTSGNESSPTSAGGAISGSTSYRGAYSGGATYLPGDLVDNGGTIYICRLQTTGNAPPNATYWGTSGTSAFLGTWNSGTAYVPGNSVTYTNAGVTAFYVCIANSTNNPPSSSPAFWQVTGASSNYVFLGVYNNGTTYYPGNQVTYNPSGGGTLYWICISQTTGNAPSQASSFWELVGTSAANLSGLDGVSPISGASGQNLVFNGDFSIATVPSGVQSATASAIRVQDPATGGGARQPSPNGWTRNFESGFGGEGYIRQIASPGGNGLIGPYCLVMQDTTNGGNDAFSAVCDAFSVRGGVIYNFSATLNVGYGTGLPANAAWYFRVLWYRQGAVDFSRSSADLISINDIVSNSTASGVQSPSGNVTSPSNAAYCRIAFYHWQNAATSSVWNILVSNVRCTNTLDDTPDGTNYARVSAAALFLGSVKSAHVSNQAVGQQTLSASLCQGSPGTNLVFSGWRKVATTVINVPAGTASITLAVVNPSQAGGGAGSAFTGIGYAIYASVDPGAPQVSNSSGAGTFNLTLSNPATGNGLTLALYIQGSGSNDGLSTSPNGFIRQTVVQILNAGSLT
jgi:hypothetical protein